MTKEKRNIIQQRLQEHNIQQAGDIQETLKNLLSGTIKEIQRQGMEEHLGYGKSKLISSADYRNGYKSEQINSSYSIMHIKIPQNCKSTFEPYVVRRYQKDIPNINQKIISTYAKGMTTQRIAEIIEDIYRFETSVYFIPNITEKIIPQIENQQNCLFSEAYPILYIDAIHYSVRDKGVIRKLATCIILGINQDVLKKF